MVNDKNCDFKNVFYTKNEINTMLLEKMGLEVVESLNSVNNPQENVIYLVPKTGGE